MRTKPSIYEIRLAIQERGMKTVEKMLETPAEKCDLCGHEEKNLALLAGHKLCEQCFLGEVENPEHSLGEKEEPPGEPRHYETAH